MNFRLILFSFIFSYCLIVNAQVSSGRERIDDDQVPAAADSEIS